MSNPTCYHASPLNEGQPSQSEYQRPERLSLPTQSVRNSREGCITHVDVFLGSLTFTSEQLACSLAVRCKDYGAQVTIRSLEEFKPDFVDSSSVPFRVAVFVISTHAAGKPSPNAEQFLFWLRKTSEANNTAANYRRPCEEVARLNSANDFTSNVAIDDRTKEFTPSQPQAALETPTCPQALAQGARPSFHVTWRLPFSGAKTSKVECQPHGILHGFQYAVFGVGNSIYRTFNAAAKYADRTLKSLGAIRVCSLGLGDISKDIDEEFTQWEVGLLRLISNHSITSSGSPFPVPKPTPPSSRASPPSTKICTDGALVEQIVVKRGPTTADLEMFIGPTRQ